MESKSWACLTILGLTLTVACSDSSTDVSGPPGPITELTGQVTGTGVQLSWSKPESGVVTLIVRFPAATGVDAVPEDYAVYQLGANLGSGEVVYVGDGTAMLDEPPCTAQVYAAWARNSGGLWSQQSQVISIQNLPGVPLEPVAGFAASIEPSSAVRLTWTSPGNEMFVRIVRKEGAAPANPEDGELVYFGAAAAANAIDQTPGFSPLDAMYYAAFPCTPCGECAAASSQADVTPTLMQALRAGGFVIYWRHATATVCNDRLDLGTATTPGSGNWWRSCDRDCATAVARQLSEEGYAEAEAIGAELRERSIPFGKVLSSEFCRCTQTAEHMALGPEIQTIPDLTFFVYNEEFRCEAVEALLAQTPNKGTNTALIGHINFPAPKCQPIANLASGEAAIFRPDGKGGFTLVDRVLPYEWAELE